MKKTIIATSIITIFIALIAVLFGAVFCLRNQCVTFLDEDIAYTKAEILSASQLKNGEPIFMIDKDKAISNIESAYPNIKVVQISTTDLMSIDIRVRTRYSTYYLENESEEGNTYYVLDEGLKVLDIVGDEPIDLIKINHTIEGAYAKGDFVMDDESDLMANLYRSVYTTALPETSTGKQAHLDICALITSVSFDKGYTLSGDYDRIIITLRSGVILDIGRPNSDLENKMNKCFSAIEQCSYTNGRVRIYYNQDNVELFEYFEN